MLGTFVMVDVESDGQIPGTDEYSMICLGAVICRPGLNDTFYGQFRPISPKWDPEALAVSGFTREQTLAFPDPLETMQKFDAWLKEKCEGTPMFISDNNGYDWSFVNWYFHHFLKRNPFGHSSSNLNSLYKGVMRDFRKNFKHLRKTKHTHHPVDDARGNAEAFVEIVNRYGFPLNRPM